MNYFPNVFRGEELISHTQFAEVIMLMDYGFEESKAIYMVELKRVIKGKWILGGCDTEIFRWIASTSQKDPDDNILARGTTDSRDIYLRMRRCQNCPTTLQTLRICFKRRKRALINLMRKIVARRNLRFLQEFVNHRKSIRIIPYLPAIGVIYFESLQRWNQNVKIY